MQVLAAFFYGLLNNVEACPILEYIKHSRDVWMVGVNEYFEIVD